VHVIWDNLNIHFDGTAGRWTAFNARHGHRFVFHYTPKHASWLNEHLAEGMALHQLDRLLHDAGEPVLPGRHLQFNGAATPTGEGTRSSCAAAGIDGAG